MVRGRTSLTGGYMVLGHEITGEVIETGSDVEFIKNGDLCSVPFNIAVRPPYLHVKCPCAHVAVDAQMWMCASGCAHVDVRMCACACAHARVHVHAILTGHVHVHVDRSVVAARRASAATPACAST